MNGENHEKKGEKFGRITKVGIHKDTKGGLDFTLHIRTTKMGTVYYCFNMATYVNGWNGIYGPKKQQGVLEATYREWHTLLPPLVLKAIKEWSLTPTSFERASASRYTAHDTPNGSQAYEVFWLAKRTGGWGGKRENAGRKKGKSETGERKYVSDGQLLAHDDSYEYAKRVWKKK